MLWWEKKKRKIAILFPFQPTLTSIMRMNREEEEKLTQVVEFTACSTDVAFRALKVSVEADHQQQHLPSKRPDRLPSFHASKSSFL